MTRGYMPPGVGAESARKTFSRVRVRVTRSTDRAFLAELPDGREIWIPDSQVDGVVPGLGTSAVVLVADWLLEREGVDPLSDDSDDAEDEVVVFRCRPRQPARRVLHATFGDGALVEDKGDRVVVDFPAPHGRKTMLKAKVQIQ